MLMKHSTQKVRDKCTMDRESQRALTHVLLTPICVHGSSQTVLRRIFRL